MSGSDLTGSDRVIYALQRCFAAVEARKAELLADVGLRPSHYAVLMNVRAHPGVRGSELARLLGVTPQNVTGLVSRMTERGLVERLQHERHEHVLELRLTPSGDDLLARADALVAGLERDAVSVLGTDRADQLREGLEALRSVAVPPTAQL